MSKEISSKIRSTFEDSIELKRIILKKDLFRALEKCGNLITESIKEGGKLMICGNGGSAADAQHLSAELLVRLTSKVNRKGLPAISLLQDSSTLTAIINDFSGDARLFNHTNNLITTDDYRDLIDHVKDEHQNLF